MDSRLLIGQSSEIVRRMFVIVLEGKSGLRVFARMESGRWSMNDLLCMQSCRDMAEEFPGGGREGRWLQGVGGGSCWGLPSNEGAEIPDQRGGTISTSCSR